jgi:hypothetical protein
VEKEGSGKKVCGQLERVGELQQLEKCQKAGYGNAEVLNGL